MNLSTIIVFTMLSASPQQETFYGLLCFTEMAAESVAQANFDGGLDLEDAVSDALVNGMTCVRLGRLQALSGYYAYEGKTIGEKKVIGISPNLQSAPQLFGLISSQVAFEPKRSA